MGVNIWSALPRFTLTPDQLGHRILGEMDGNPMQREHIFIEKSKAGPGVACSSGEALQQVSPASRFARISGEGEQRVNEKRSHHAAQGHNHIVMTREALSCNIRELDSSWDRITPRAQRI